MTSQARTYLEAACTMADRLLKCRKHDAHGRYWETLTFNGLQQPVLHTSENLYSGNAGIALVFAELFGLTQNPTYQKAAEESLAWLFSYCKTHPPISFGGYTGRTSVFFPLIRYAEISGERRFLEQALVIAGPCWNPEWSQWPDPMDDLLSGRAGALLAFLHLHAATGEGWLLQPIDFLIKGLIHKAQPGPEGFYWDHSAQQIAGLCGLSHGAAGIGFVFSELSAYFSNPTFHHIASLAFSYENVHFRHYQAWPDFRKAIYSPSLQEKFLNAYASGDFEFFQKPGQMDVWCHGAAGIGLSRLMAFQKHGKSADSMALNQALKIILQEESLSDQKSFAGFNSLCHGRAGNRDFLIEASQILQRPDLLPLCQSLGNAMVDHIEKGGIFASGYPNVAQPDTSLLMGDAGMVYYLLRLAAPATVRCILAPRLTRPADKPLHLDTHAFISMTFSEAQRHFLERIYPRTLRQMDALTPEGVQSFLCEHLSRLDLRREFVEFVQKKISTQVKEADQDLAACFHLESLRYERQVHCKSRILIHVRHLAHRLMLDGQVPLTSEQLASRSLVLNPDLTFFSHCTQPNHPPGNDPQWGLLIPQDATFLERWLSPLSHLVLKAFQNPDTVNHQLPKILEHIHVENSSDWIKATAFVLDQIHQELKLGCLHFS